MAETVLQWLAANWPEVTGSLLGLLSVYFQYRQNPLLWPVSLVVAALYTYVFVQSGLYAYTVLQIYYFAISIYGWHLWIRKSNDSEALKVTYTKGREALVLSALALVLFIALFSLLLFFTDSNVPYADAFITALSFIATWMLAKKRLENWLVWLVADIMSVGLYLHKELYATAVFYTILTFMAVAGYLKWKKQITT